MHPNALLDLTARLVHEVLKLDAPADSTVSYFFKAHKTLGQRERHALAETGSLGREPGVAHEMFARSRHVELIGGGEPASPFATVVAMQQHMVVQIANRAQGTRIEQRRADNGEELEGAPEPCPAILPAARAIKDRDVDVGRIDEVGIVAGGQCQADFRVTIDEGAEAGHEPKGEQSRDTGDAQAAAGRGAVHQRGCRRNAVESLGDGRQEKRALRRQLEPLAAALEKRRLQRFFQAPYLMRYRAVGHAQLPRGSRDRATAGGGLEGAQGVERGQATCH